MVSQQQLQKRAGVNKNNTEEETGRNRLSLQSHQRDASKKLRDLLLKPDGRGAYVKGGVGAGKTALVIHALQKTRKAVRKSAHPAKPPARALIVVPLQVLSHWASEMPRVLSASACANGKWAVFHGDRRHSPDALARVRKATYVLTTFQTAMSDIKRLGLNSFLIQRKWRYVAFDEAHLLRNGISLEDGSYATKTFEFLDVLMKKQQPRVVLVSATPVMNSPDDLFSQAVWMNARRPDAPGCHMADRKIWRARRASVAAEAADTTTDRRPEVVDDGAPVAPDWRTVQVELLRRMVIVTPPEFPELRVETVTHGWTPEEKTAYQMQHRQTVRAMMEYMNLKRARRPRADVELALCLFRGHLTRLRRGCLLDRFFEKPTTEAAAVPSAAVAYAGCSSSKFECLAKLLRERDDLRGHRVVVFSCFREPLEALRVFLERTFGANGPDRVHCLTHYGGRDNGPIRAEFARRPSRDDDPTNRTTTLFFATRGSMGVGVNLYSARRCIMLDRDFSYAAEEQARGRIRRPLAQRIHDWLVIYLEHENPCVEQWMRDLQLKKQEDIGSFAEPDDVADEEVNNSSTLQKARDFGERDFLSLSGADGEATSSSCGSSAQKTKSSKKKRKMPDPPSSARPSTPTAAPSSHQRQQLQSQQQQQQQQRAQQQLARQISDASALCAQLAVVNHKKRPKRVVDVMAELERRRAAPP